MMILMTSADIAGVMFASWGVLALTVATGVCAFWAIHDILKR